MGTARTPRGAPEPLPGDPAGILGSARQAGPAGSRAPCSLLVSAEVLLPDFPGSCVPQRTLNLRVKSGGSSAELGGEQFDFLG